MSDEAIEAEPLLIAEEPKEEKREVLQGTIFGEWVAPATSLASSFGAPPFSVLDAKQPYWQSRKRQWIALGIKSEVGRGENLLKFSASINAKQAGAGKTYDEAKALTGDEKEGAQAEGTSIFDPVLCELAYRWWSPPDGLVLDPFAGGSVRGIVASMLGRRYLGFDLRAEQVAANAEQAARLCVAPFPEWRAADARSISKSIEPESVDYIFTCPPYFDLEKYSESEADLSAMSDADFIKAYCQIISHCADVLKPNRFACFVVGNARTKKGNGALRDLAGVTIQAFENAGLEFYNDAILLTSIGTLPLRIRKQWMGSRKLGRTHQYVLVFVKGNAKEAAALMEKNAIDVESLQTEGETES